MERDKKELEQVKNHLMQVTQERARHEAMVARMKELHIEQCQELEKQIEIVSFVESINNSLFLYFISSDLNLSFTFKIIFALLAAT